MTIFLPQVSCSRTAIRALAMQATVAIALGVFALPTQGYDRDRLLSAKPLASCEVQPLAKENQAATQPAVIGQGQPSEEDPLSFYARTQDGEWAIPQRMDRNDPWIRVLLLNPSGPVLVDLALQIGGKSYRDSREQWVDRLLAEAEATTLVREGSLAAQSISIEQPSNPSVEAEGTSADAVSSEENSPDATADEPAAEDPAAKDPDAPVMTEAQSRETRTLFQRLINYLAADQTTAEREEVRWLLAEWTGGPEQLTLGPALAWRRAAVARLWGTLDADGDHRLSAEEIAGASDRLKAADVDQDDVVTAEELFHQAGDRSPYGRVHSYPLVVVIDENTDWRALDRDLRDAYPIQSGVQMPEADVLARIRAGDGTRTRQELVELATLPADLVGRVNLGGEADKMQLLFVSLNQSGAVRQVSSTSSAITVELDADYMELSAAQGPAGVEGDMRDTQIAVGAVVDGDPLWRLLDLDGDGRLTLRERRELEPLLGKLDHDDDGTVSTAEVPTAIRLAVTRGPNLHQHLRTAVPAQREGPTEAKPAPQWFVGMDRNNDGDLTPREFQGSPAQFAQLDHDGDGLISAREVQDSPTGGE